MNFLDYKTKLEEHGYTVTAENVTTRMGDVLAAFDPYGSYWCVDSKVSEILSEDIAVEEVVAEKVRARTDRGHYVKDDPSTPENEAWTTKAVKKIKKSKGTK
tara:strand:- start:224 stop:529 length:306 start_codon:yes stop_codon:yes gene_type:complete